MRHLSQSIKVGILVIILAIGSYGVWRTFSSSASGGDTYMLWAKLRDASGLPIGSKVVVAGLPVGEISKLGIVGRRARINMDVRTDVAVYDDAVLFKKSSSLLGSHYVEIDPGLPVTISATGEKVHHRRLKNGDQITHVVEETSPEQLMREVQQLIPKVDEVLLSVRDLSEDVRSLVNGPLANAADRINQLVQQQTSTVADILERIDKITKDVHAVTHGADKRVDDILDNIDQASKKARDLMTTAKGEVKSTGKSIRGAFDRGKDVMAKIDDDKGTLGKLVNDPTIANNVEDITDEAKGFLGTLFGIQTYVGLRSEYNVMAQLVRSYVTISLYTRPDKFYYIEIEKGPRGDYPVVNLVWDRNLGAFAQEVTIEDKPRFTFQFGKRIGNFALRYGLKESTGGGGADAWFFHDDLKLSLDMFDFTWDQWPRLKFTAAYAFFHHLYILGGVDDILNPGRELPINVINSPVPTQFQTFHYGRDYFFGGMLRFNDSDLAALLTIGGSAISGAL